MIAFMELDDGVVAGKTRVPAAEAGKTLSERGMRKR